MQTQVGVTAPPVIAHLCHGAQCGRTRECSPERDPHNQTDGTSAASPMAAGSLDAYCI